MEHRLDASGRYVPAHLTAMGRVLTASLGLAATVHPRVADVQSVERHWPPGAGQSGGVGRSRAFVANPCGATSSALLSSVLAEAVGFERTLPFQAFRFQVGCNRPLCHASAALRTLGLRRSIAQPFELNPCSSPAFKSVGRATRLGVAYGGVDADGRHCRKRRGNDTSPDTGWRRQGGCASRHALWRCGVHLVGSDF